MGLGSVAILTQAFFVSTARHASAFGRPCGAQSASNSARGNQNGHRLNGKRRRLLYQSLADGCANLVPRLAAWTLVLLCHIQRSQMVAIRSGVVTC
jgi:hypothetical protein